MKIRNLMTIVVLGLLLSACSQDAAEKIAKLSDFTPTINTRPAWAVEVGHGSEKNYLRLAPIVNNQSIYVSDYHGDVLSINRQNGRVRWHAALKDHITSGVGAGDNTLVVGTQSGNVYGLNVNSGKVLWRARVSDEVIATPTIAHNKVFIKTQSGMLSALNATNGKKLWEYREANPSLVLRSDSAVVTNGELAVSGFSDGALIAFDMSTGKSVWHIQLAVPHGISPIERMVDITADPYVEDGVLYVTSYQGQIAAVNISSGNIIWKKDFSGYTGIAVGPDALYVTDAKSHVWAFNKTNGMVLWHNDHLDGRGVSGPAYDRGKIVVGDKKGFVHWMAARDGHFIARDKADKGSIFATPIATRQMTYVYSSRGQLVGYTVQG